MSIKSIAWRSFTDNDHMVKIIWEFYALVNLGRVAPPLSHRRRAIVRTTITIDAQIALV